MSDDSLELARRALAAAERRRAEQEAGAELEGRLRLAADDGGRVTVEAALDALRSSPAEPDRPAEARLFEDYAARQRAAVAHLFPKREEGE